MTAANRGRNVAMFGALLQAVLAGLMLAAWLWTNSMSAISATLMLAGGVLVWLLVAVIFHCRRLAELEAEEIEAISRGAVGGAAMFQNIAETRPAEHRVKFVIKWIVPIFSLLMAGYQSTIGVLVFSKVWTVMSVWNEAPRLLENTSAMAMVLVLGAFLGFLASRYATGMSGILEWRLLRAPGSYLFVSVLAVAVSAIGLFCVSEGKSYLDLLIAAVIPILQAAIAVELVLNFILDIYRPRVPGQEQRLSFDSRLLNLIAQPGRVGHSIAETLNYQFGFEVSKTWFYQLFSKAVVPLVFLGSAILLAMTCLVVVDSGQKTIVYHFGKMEKIIETPGVYLKMPWPIDTMQRFDADRVRMIYLGVGGKAEDAAYQETIVNGRELILWTQEHGQRKELDFLVAVPPENISTTSGGDSDGVGSVGDVSRPPPVNILKLVIAVQYKVVDVNKFSSSTVDSATALELAAYREMTNYCASATLNTPLPEKNAPEAILTYGQKRAAEVLRERIQTAADSMGLGVEVSFVGIESVHPPANKVADAFEEVLAAERRQDEERYRAEALANTMLANVTGDPEKAMRLALEIRMLEGFVDLQNVAGDKAKQATMLDEMLNSCRNDMKRLEREIARDSLLGLGNQRGDKKSDSQNLLERCKQYSSQLESMRNGVSDEELRRLIGQSQLAVTAMMSRDLTGDAARIIADAQGDRWETTMAEKARYVNYSNDLTAYQAGGKMYRYDRVMDVLEQTLPNIQKYVLGIDRQFIEVWMNLEQNTTSFGDIDPNRQK